MTNVHTKRRNMVPEKHTEHRLHEVTYNDRASHELFLLLSWTRRTAQGYSR